MDLIRKLLLTIELHPFTAALENPRIEGYEAETVDHHVHLLWKAGLVDAEDIGYTGAHRAAAARALTWDGHEALAALRNETVWARTKELLAKAGGASVSIMLDLAKQVAKEQLGLSN
jgi:hypothetical protein